MGTIPATSQKPWCSKSTPVRYIKRARVIVILHIPTGNCEEAPYKYGAKIRLNSSRRPETIFMLFNQHLGRFLRGHVQTDKNRTYIHLLA